MSDSVTSSSSPEATAGAGVDADHARSVLARGGPLCDPDDYVHARKQPSAAPPVPDSMVAMVEAGEVPKAEKVLDLMAALEASVAAAKASRRPPAPHLPGDPT